MNARFPLTNEGVRNAMKPDQDYALILHPSSTLDRNALQAAFPRIKQINDHPLIPEGGALLVEHGHYTRHLTKYRYPA